MDKLNQGYASALRDIRVMITGAYDPERILAYIDSYLADYDKRA